MSNVLTRLKMFHIQLFNFGGRLKKPLHGPQNKRKGTTRSRNSEKTKDG